MSQFHAKGLAGEERYANLTFSSKTTRENTFELQKEKAALTPGHFIIFLNSRRMVFSFAG